jgi:HSP20 family protein
MKGKLEMLTRFYPVADFDRLSSELLGAFSRKTSSMPMDAYRHNDQWVVAVDLPGVDPATIDLTVDRNVLRIEASRNWRPAEGDVVLAAERPRGTFSRQLVLSEDIDTQSIKADYHDGVLTVTLPVAEVAKPKKVSIVTAAPTPTQTQQSAVEAEVSEAQAA